MKYLQLQIYFHIVHTKDIERVRAEELNDVDDTKKKHTYYGKRKQITIGNHWYNSQHCLCVPTVTNGSDPVR